MTKRDWKTVNDCRKNYCERCGRPANIEPHHIFTRGAGGRDIRENLVQLCTDCHIGAHSGHVSRDSLVHIVAEREHHSDEYVYAVNRAAMGYDVEIPNETEEDEQTTLVW